MSPLLDDELAAALPAVADPERLSAVQRTGLLDGPDTTLDTFARLAAAVLAAPAAYVTLVDADRQVAPGAVQLDRPGEPGRVLQLSDSICQFSVATGEPLIIDDTRANQLVQHKAGVVSGDTRAYAGVPLRTGSGHVLGALCVHDRTPRTWTPEQVGLLDELALLVSRDLEHRLAARREVEFQRLTSRMDDEVASLSDAVSTLVELAEQQDDPRLQRFAALSRSRLQHVRQLARECATIVAPQQTAPVRPAPLELRRTLQRAVNGARAATGSEAFALELPPARMLVQCESVRLERALTHLLVSALHHTPPGEGLALRLQPVESGDEVRRAELTLDGPSTQLSAAELGRIVGRFSQALCGAAAPRATVQLVGGRVQVSSGVVSARSGRDGLGFRVTWDLVDEPARSVIRLP